MSCSSGVSFKNFVQHFRSYKFRSNQLSLVMSLIASFLCCPFSPRDVLDEIWDLIELVSEDFSTCSYIIVNLIRSAERRRLSAESVFTCCKLRETPVPGLYVAIAECHVFLQVF